MSSSGKTIRVAFRRLLLVVLGLLWFGGRATVLAAPPVAREYQVKAAFLYNFTKFVEWAPQRFPDHDAPIVIGVLGRNPFGDELGKIVQGRQVNGRAIVVRNVASAAEAATVTLLFIPGGEERRFAGNVEALRKAGVLTVGESPQFASHGGMIVFNLEGDKIRFEINRGAAERAGLKISPQLLKLAVRN